MLVAAGLISFAGCEAVSNEQLFAPTASVNQNAAEIATTRSLAGATKRSATIGAEGGSVSVNGHTLIVPANAVSSPTVFSMQVVEARAVHVKLRAVRVSDGAAVTQFPIAPVQLTLDARDVDATDLSGLKVVYLVDGTYDGNREILQNSAVDVMRRTVSAHLSHFSDYSAVLD